jgi:DNA polymerase III sliding clamp (beta) subunit (PCNA family)
MEVVVNSKELGTALKSHARVCKSKNHFSQMMNDVVLLSATWSELTVTSTDLTQYLTTRHACTSDSSTVSVLVDVATLHKALAAIKGPASLEFPETAGAGSVLTVRGAGVEFHVTSLDPVCFPCLPVRGAVVAEYAFTSDEYSHIIGRVAPSMNRDIKRRLEFQGVCFRQREHLEIMATDARRLARVTLIGDPTTPGEWNIPTKAIECFAPAGDVVVTFEADQCGLRSGDTELVTLLNGTEFPAVDSIIPAAPEYTVEMDREQLRAALITLGAKSGPGDLVVKLQFNNGGVLNITTADGTGAATTHYTGGAGDVAPYFFAGYFLDGVTASDPVVTMKLDSDTQPVILAGDSFLYLVMPHKTMEA